MVVHFFSIWYSRRVSGKFVWVYGYFAFICGTVLGFWVTCFGFTDYFVFFYIWFSLWFLEILAGFMVTVVVPGRIIFYHGTPWVDGDRLCGGGYHIRGV
jgi:hypothetical protein